MFSFLKKDSSSKLNKQYKQLLEKALQAQRRGDIRSYSELSAEAEKIADKIDKLLSLIHI